jgi:hypothetical protein
MSPARESLRRRFALRRWRRAADPAELADALRTRLAAIVEAVEDFPLPERGDDYRLQGWLGSPRGRELLALAGERLTIETELATLTADWEERIERAAG